jgi:hypothetical protein
MIISFLPKILLQFVALGMSEDENESRDPDKSLSKI